MPAISPDKTDSAKHSAAQSAATSAALPRGLWVAAMPLIFVVIWSTGFIAAKYGLPYAPPLTFLLLRFAMALMVLLPVVMLMRPSWPRRQAWHIALAGVLVHAGYLGGVWNAIKIGMPAGLSALIVGMQPILTAFAAPLIGESVRSRQWLGLLFGFCGVALVVANKINLSGLSWESIASCLLALLSITVGTLYQKHYCPHFDLGAGTVIQYAACAIVMLPLAIAFESLDIGLSTVQWTPQFIGALLWSVFALSISAIFLLFVLIRKNAATSVTSMLYLTPPTTALMAWAIFGEAMGIMGIVGMALAATGVAFVLKK